MGEKKKQLGRDKVSRLVNWGHWFAFINGIFAMIIGNRYIETVGYPDTWIGWGYLSISTIGHFSFLAFIVYLITLFPLTIIMPYSRILRGVAATIASLSLYVLLYDTIIYDDYGLHLSPFSFDLAWTDLNAILHGTSYIIAPLAIIAIELTLANFLWKRIDKIQRKNWGNKVVAFVGICFVSSHLIHIWADAADVTQITRFDDTYPLSYPATARSFMESHGIESNTARHARSNNIEGLTYPIEPLQCHQQQQSNVLMITVDGLRADLINAKTMPFLTQYAAKNQDFTNHLSGGNEYASGMFSLLYGLQGSYMDAYDLTNTPPLLSQTLVKSGYKLALFTDKHTEVIDKSPAIFKQFKHYISDDAQQSSANNDLASVAHFEQWQPKQTAPWFALVNLTAPESYDTPAGFWGIETVKPNTPLKPAQKVLFNQYRQSINFIDQQLAQLVKAQPADTIIIITGVSGKVFTSNANEAKNNLSPANVKVPLIIHWPDGAASRINYRTSHYGLVPTLMTKLLGCTNPSTDYSAGRSLLQPNSQNWVYVGDNRIFAIYQKQEITVIDRHGKYRIYDNHYLHQLDKRLSGLISFR